MLWLDGLGFAENSQIRRGYGTCTTDGEVEETSIGPFKHVAFIVNGIS